MLHIQITIGVISQEKLELVLNKFPIYSEVIMEKRKQAILQKVRLRCGVFQFCWFWCPS